LRRYASEDLNVASSNRGVDPNWDPYNDEVEKPAGLGVSRSRRYRVEALRPHNSFGGYGLMLLCARWAMSLIESKDSRFFREPCPANSLETSGVEETVFAFPGKALRETRTGDES